MKMPATSHKKGQSQRRNAPASYPFTAIVGQEEMKLALLLNVIDPLIGGVLIMGHRGTGKSTAVRAIADLLPQIWRATNCHYGCDPDDVSNLCGDCSKELMDVGKLARRQAEVPVVNLPLGATEDRVCGTIDIERALKDGVKAFEPGILARANRGFLYVDEVNLLEDHLVDLLLDVAVTGRNTVEREGISLEHPARFVLVGSGNPEEGELRPQLVDRFGLCAEVQTLIDLGQRVEIMELREAFERDPSSLKARFESEQVSLRRRLGRARKLAGNVKIPRELVHEIAGICLRLSIDGHRGELTIARAARALAALDGRKQVAPDDIRRVAPLALRHRLRREPLEPTNGGGSRIEQALDDLFSHPESDASKDKRKASSTSVAGAPRDSLTGGRNNADNGRSLDGSQPTLTPAAQPASLSENVLKQYAQLLTNHSKKNQSSKGKRNLDSPAYNARHGRYSRAVMHRSSGSKPALDATLRAFALSVCSESTFPKSRPPRQSKPYTLSPTPCLSDLRFKAFRRKQGTLFIIAVDASGSMALNRIERSKGAVGWLLSKSYVSRDRVALVSFRGQAAEEVLGPSQSMSRAHRSLDQLMMGGPTPLASALVCSLNIATRARRQGAERIVLFVFTDGRANVALRGGGTNKAAFTQAVIKEELTRLRAELIEANVTTVVVDTQNRFTSGGEARDVSDLLNAHYVYLST